MEAAALTLCRRRCIEQQAAERRSSLWQCKGMLLHGCHKGQRSLCLQPFTMPACKGQALRAERAGPQQNETPRACLEMRWLPERAHPQQTSRLGHDSTHAHPAAPCRAVASRKLPKIGRQCRAPPRCRAAAPR